MEAGGLLDAWSDSLQNAQGRMPFVQVKGFWPDAQRLQDASAPHAKEDFLAQPLLRVADVETTGDVAVSGAIDLEIRIQQVEPGPTHLHLAGADVDSRIKGRDPHYQRLTVLIQGAGDGGVTPIQALPNIVLAAVLSDVLMDVYLRVNHAHRDHGDGGIAALNEIVTRQNDQSTVIDRERSV